jgi:D-amino-acid dehydrogenase
MTTIIVVGGGILGASATYHLAKAGVKVILVDRGDSGQATDAAVGMICPWISQRRNQAWYKLAKSGARYYPVLIEELKQQGIRETGYARVGVLSLHTDEKKLDILEERAYGRRLDAPEMGEITRLSTKQTQALFPPLAEGYSAVYISGGARVNGRALREALVLAAKGLGMVYLRGNARLLWREYRVVGVEVNGTIYYGDQVVVAAGAWLNQLLAPLGMNSQVFPQKGQIVHLQLPQTETGTWPVVMPPNNQYILAFEDGRIVVGTTHEDEAGFDDRVTAGGIHTILDKALDAAPGLASATVLEMRAGIRPKTPQFLPVFGAVPGYQGLWVANGLGSTGLTVGPYLGAELAKLVLGQPTELNPAEYDLTLIIKSM